MGDNPSKPSIVGARSELRSGAAGRAWPFHLHWNGHFRFDTACDAPWQPPGSALPVLMSLFMRLEGDGESESARPDHAPDDHPFHSNPIPITCARRRSTVDAYLVDLVMAVGERREKGADRLRWCGDEGVSFQGTEQVLSYPWSAPSEHARGPHPRLNHLASRVRCRCVFPQASISPGDEGCARGTRGL